MVSGNATAATSAGWTQRNLTGVSGQTLTLVERILDGTEVSPVTFTWTGTASVFTLQWLFRNSHPTAAIEVSIVGTGASATTLAHAALTPSWGLANTTWVGILALSDRTSASNVLNAPSILRRGINAATISATASLSGQLIGGDVKIEAPSRVASITIPAWTWNDATAAQALTFAVRPNDALASAALDYHYWTIDVEGAGKSALKSPLQMG
jgi:hypothetical protein